MTHNDLKECLYGRLNFRSENYIEQVDSNFVGREQFDIVVCLSTIKWIHLNFNDVGLKALFLKVRDQLSTGGLFIFDSQPWKSYKKVQEKDKMQIELKPHCFKAYLKAIGFKLINTVDKTRDETKLEKVIYIYMKV